MSTEVEEQLYFYTMYSMSRELGRKKLNIVRDAVNSTLACMAPHFVQAAWYLITKDCSLRLLRITIRLYFCLISENIPFHVLSQQSDGCVSLKQQETVLEVGHSCRGLKEWTLP